MHSLDIIRLKEKQAEARRIMEEEHAKKKERERLEREKAEETNEKGEG